MMKLWNRTCVLTLYFILVSSTSMFGASVISSYENPPTPVRRALHRLSDYTGLGLDQASGKEPAIRVKLNSAQDPKIGAQGYTIRSASDGSIAIHGNTDEGAANGVYTVLRTLMAERRKDPFSRKWDLEEKPHFTVRAMLVAPYRYGASFGFAALSPDRWSLEEWKEYVDFMRLCNMTTLTMASTRMYHPDYPHSEREKFRFEVWKDVMDYCHQVGMKFNWFMFPYMVTEQAFWENPDKRNDMYLSWWGSNLSWHKAKDLILKINRYIFEYYRGLDGLELIYTDGGAHLDEPDPAGYLADATRSYMKLMRDVGNSAGFVYWNWILDFTTQAEIPEDLAKKNPKFKRVQDDVIPLLPKEVTWLDASMLTLIQHYQFMIRAAGNPPLREGILLGKEAGFKPIIEFFWYMNPETALNMFPHPYLRRTIQEAQYARDETGADGVEGYRLAPPMRFINDYAFFRLASDPSLTQEQIVNELAGLLAEKSENQEKVKEAIHTLEQFWTTRKLEDIEKAETLFRGVLPQEKSKNLLYVSNGVTFLTYIARLAQPAATAAQKAQLKRELYETVKPMYIFQGLTADIVWLPEATRFFNARVDMLVQDYSSRFFGPRMDVVDRSIYPKATTKPFTLQWPKTSSERKP